MWQATVRNYCLKTTNVVEFDLALIGKLETTEYFQSELFIVSGRSYNECQQNAREKTLDRLSILTMTAEAGWRRVINRI